MNRISSFVLGLTLIGIASLALAADFSQLTVTTLGGHSASVVALETQPVPNGLIAAASGAYVQLLDATGEVKANLYGHTRGVTALAWQNRGNVLVSGGEDGRVRFWSAPSWKETSSLDLKRTVTALAFSPDGSRLAAATSDGGVRLYLSGKFLRSFAGHEESVDALAWNPKGTLIASGDRDGVTRIWDAATAKIVKSLPTLENAIFALSFSADGSRLYRVSSDVVSFETLKWAAQGKPFKLPSARITDFKLSGSSAALSASGGQVYTWDLKSASAKLLGQHDDGVSAVAWLGGRVVSGGADGAIRTWDVKAAKEIAVKLSMGSYANDLSFNSTGRLLASASDDPRVLIWDVATSKVAKTLKAGAIWPISLEFSSNDELLAVGYDDGTLVLWDVMSGKERRRIEADSSVINSVSFSINSKLLAVGGGDGITQIYDVATGKLLRSEKSSGEDQAELLEVSYSRDGRYVAAGHGDGVLSILDADTLAVVSTFEDAEEGVVALAWNDDGLLAAASFDGTTRVYDPASEQLVSSMTMASGAQAFNVAFSPDGLTVAVAGGDGALRLFETSTGRVVQSYPNHSDKIYSVAFSPDGQRLAVGAGRLEAGGAISLYAAPNGSAVFGTRQPAPVPVARASVPAAWSAFNIAEGLSLRLSPRYRVTGIDGERVQISDTESATRLELRGLGGGSLDRLTLLEAGLGAVKLECLRAGLRCGDPISATTLQTANGAQAYTLVVSQLAPSGGTAVAAPRAPLLLIDARDTGGLPLVVVSVKSAAAGADGVALLREFASAIALETSR